MTLIWLLPTLITGVVLALVTHSWLFLVLSLVTASATLLTQRLRNSEKLTGPVHLSAAGVAIGDRVLPRSFANWRPEWRDLVLDAVRAELAARAAAEELAQLAATGFELADAEAIAGLAGFGANGQVRLNLAFDGPHLFVIGPTGSGKSRWLEMYLGSLVNSHQNLELWLADFKGGATLGHLSGLQTTRGFITDLVSGDDFWRALHEYIAARELDFANRGIARIDQVNDLPRQLLVVDELLPALRSSPIATSVVETVATRGRSLGIHLIVASQGTSGMGRLLLSSLRARLALQGTDAVDLAQLGITKKLPSEAKPGQGVALLVTPSESTEVRFPLAFSPVPLPVVLPRGRVRRRPVG